MLQVELDGSTYRYVNGAWYDSSFVAAPDVIVAQLEEQHAPPPAEAPAPRRRTSRGGGSTSGWGRDFQGLSESDMKENVTGTHWRSRASLGGALALAMRARTGHDFVSFPVPRRPQLYLALPERLGDDKHPCAKYWLQLSSKEALSGLYCEKNDGPMDERWDWTRLLTALQGEALPAQLQEAMAAGGLEWLLRPYDQEGKPLPAIRVAPGEPLNWQEAGQAPETVSWQAFVERLSAWPEAQWLDVSLGRSRSAEQVLAAGALLPSDLADEFAALWPLYEACTLRRGD